LPRAEIHPRGRVPAGEAGARVRALPGRRPATDEPPTSAQGLPPPSEPEALAQQVQQRVPVVHGDRVRGAVDSQRHLALEPSAVETDSLSRSEHPVMTTASAAPVAAEAAMNVRRDRADSGFTAGSGQAVLAPCDDVQDDPSSSGTAAPTHLSLSPAATASHAQAKRPSALLQQAPLHDEAQRSLTCR
jgi:hypothetical protein